MTVIAENAQRLLATNEFLAAVSALPLATWSRLSMEALAAAKHARTLHAGAEGDIRVALRLEAQYHAALARFLAVAGKQA